MPVSYAELKAKLDVDEPDYAALAKIAANATGHLRKLVASAEVVLATKAVSLAGFIRNAGSIDVVEDAAKSRDPLVRVAAAHSAGMLPESPKAARVVSKLLADPDVGGVKTATRAAARQSIVEPKLRRARTRMTAGGRAAAKAHSRQKREEAMATKASKKAARSASRRESRTRAAARQMPTGRMAESPKGAKARLMPAGKMR